MKNATTAFLTVLVGSAALAVSAQNYSAPSQNTPAQTRPVPSVTTPMRDVQPLALSDAPKSVQQSIRKRAGTSVVREVDQANWNGQTVYSVVVDNHGNFSQYIFDQNGKVLSEPGRPISEAAGTQPNHSSESDIDAQHDHRILQQPK